MRQKNREAFKSSASHHSLLACNSTPTEDVNGDICKTAPLFRGIINTLFAVTINETWTGWKCLRCVLLPTLCKTDGKQKSTRGKEATGEDKGAESRKENKRRWNLKRKPSLTKFGPFDWKVPHLIQENFAGDTFRNVFCLFDTHAHTTPSATWCWDTQHRE